MPIDLLQVEVALALSSAEKAPERELSASGGHSESTINCDRKLSQTLKNATGDALVVSSDAAGASVSLAYAMQHYPSGWGHYDVCKSQIYTEEGLAWDYMACQPEATDMTKYLRVTLDPPNITCGDPPKPTALW
ncbi:hypothetical protein WMY93_000990 [Mugilogobius chulae]|uniref:Uncharacterized protein n=1 Tax=Mugilogobius chulae TaxID=88201 RepID=A0AAW0Q3J2_9GOBI